MITKKLFLAIEVPEEIKKQVSEFQLAHQDLEIRWKNPNQIHLTLVFLGEIPIGKISDIIAKTEDVCLKNPDFIIKLVGINQFRKSKNRVVFIVVDHPQKVVQFHQELISDLSEYLDKRKNIFKAHVTIGKAKKGVDVFSQLNEFEELEFGEYKVEKIALFESESKSEGGTEYNLINSFYLK